MQSVGVSSSVTWVDLRGGAAAVPPADGRRRSEEFARASAQSRLERVEEHRRDVETALLRDLLKAGRAGHVDLGQAVADHVEADQQQAARNKDRAQVLGDLAVAGTGRLGHALAADREVAADLAALRNARKRMRHGLAAD